MCRAAGLTLSPAQGCIQLAQGMGVVGVRAWTPWASVLRWEPGASLGLPSLPWDAGVMAPLEVY